LTDRVVVLRPTWHKIGHFADVPQADFLAWYRKTKTKTTKAHTDHSKEMYYNTKINIKKIKPGLVASYDIRPGNGGPILVLALHNLSLTYLLRHLPTYSPGTHTGQMDLYKSRRI